MRAGSRSEVPPVDPHTSLLGVPHNSKYRGCTHGWPRFRPEGPGLDGDPFVRNASPHRKRLLSQARTMEIRRGPQAEHP